MARMIEFPGGGSAAVVTAVDIDNLFVTAERIASAQQLHERIAVSILDRLAAGAEVEDGTHYVDRKTVEIDSVFEERLVIDHEIRFRRSRRTATRIEGRPASNAAASPMWKNRVVGCHPLTFPFPPPSGFSKIPLSPGGSENGPHYRSDDRRLHRSALFRDYGPRRCILERQRGSQVYSGDGVRCRWMDLPA